jgi:hypothetical protein
VVATPALAEKTAPAGKVLPFLDKFLKRAAGRPDAPEAAYGIRRDGQPAPNLKATLVEKSGARTPLSVNGEGYFERLPTLGSVERRPHGRLRRSGRRQAGHARDFGTQLKPAAEYDARELTATVAEANT